MDVYNVVLHLTQKLRNNLEHIAQIRLQLLNLIKFQFEI